MKKKILYIIIILLIFIVNKSYSNQPIAQAYIDNVTLISYDTMTFEIRLKKVSKEWAAFGNGTFLIQFVDTNYKLNSSTIGFNRLNSNLPLGALTGELPTEKYYISDSIFNGHLGIYVLGPVDYQNCVLVNDIDSNILVGKYLLYTINHDYIPIAIKFKEPFTLYQACAYKLPKDTLINKGFYYENDNIEMLNLDQSTYVEFTPGYAKLPAMVIDSFVANYDGQKKVDFTWRSFNEYNVEGYLIARAKWGIDRDSSQLEYNDTVASFQNLSLAEFANLKGKGAISKKARYSYASDTVANRGDLYCYKLFSKDFQGNSTYRGSYCLPIPNALIVWAGAVPNPFQLQSTLSFEVLDDVRMKIEAYDVNGKLIKPIYDDEKSGTITRKGIHGINMSQGAKNEKTNTYEGIDFSVTKEIAQTYFQIVLTAYPINDNSIQASRAIVNLFRVNNE